MFFVSEIHVVKAEQILNFLPERRLPIDEHSKRFIFQTNPRSMNSGSRIKISPLCRNLKKFRGYEEPAILASETAFTINEVEALYELFKKISSTIVDDGLIHKEDFMFALFRNSSRQNLFADRIFQLFDIKRNGVIEFGEFVRSLSVFHPNAPVSDKIAFAFRLYDLNHNGYIERNELKEMVVALLNESNLSLANDVIETIVDNTFSEADSNGDGKIDKDEWKEYANNNPSVLKIMTLPHLMDITVAFPSFVLNTEVEDTEI